MNRNSRTKNTIYNFISSVGGQFIGIVVQFVVRTVFIHTLGKSYLGIGSLFGNILSMLSLAELGVGSAILFKLYEPIATDNKARIRALLKFYKNAYRLIGIAIAVIGLCLIPFLPVLIKDYAQLSILGLNPVLIFGLYLFSSVSSYLFFAYRSAIIQADQKEYITTILGYCVTIAVGIIQIVCLLVFHSFTLYVIILIGQVILYNILCALVSQKLYPDIWIKCEDKLEKKEVISIIKDCGALFLYKLNAAVVNATDNIVLSAFIGLDVVAMYANYFVFYSTITGLLNKIFNAVGHSLGNLHATDNTKHEYEVFEIVMFVATMLGSVGCVGIFVCADEFVNIWIGNDWVLAQPFSLLMGLEIYTFAIRAALAKYRQAMGLFRQSKLRPVMGMLINIIVSIGLVNVCGIYGVVIGTISADWLTFMWLDPYIVHKYGFHNSYPVSKYYKKYLINFALTCGVGAMNYYICSNYIIGYGWLSICAHAIICAVTVFMCFILIYWRTNEVKYLVSIGKRYIKKIVAR